MWEQSSTVRERVHYVDSRVKTCSGGKRCAFAGVVAPGVSKVRSVFPLVRASIGEKLWTKEHLYTIGSEKVDDETASRVLFAHHTVTKLYKIVTFGHFWKMRSKTCSRDFSESSIRTSQFFNLVTFRAILEEVGNGNLKFLKYEYAGTDDTGFSFSAPPYFFARTIALFCMHAGQLFHH